MTSLYPPETTAIIINPLGATSIDYQDSKDIWKVETLPKTDVLKTAEKQLPFLSLVGVVPTQEVANDLTIKIPLSLLLSGTLSLWISNFFLLGIFTILNITNFITSLIWDKKADYREKVSRLIADFVLIAIVATFADLVFGAIQIPSTQINISVLAIGLYLMILSYLVLIPKRLLPLASLTQSKTLKNFVLACKKGLDDFKERQEKEILQEN